jgi:hypothetical protein
VQMALSTMSRLHVVLFRPLIPGNTGNAGRTCLGVGAKLHLVKYVVRTVTLQFPRIIGVTSLMVPLSGALCAQAVRVFNRRRYSAAGRAGLLVQRGLGSV